MIKKDNLINMKKFKISIIMLMLISVPVMSKNMTNQKSESYKIYSQAEVEYKKHNYSEAINLYKKALIQKPEEDTQKTTVLKLIETLILAKKWDDAIAILDKYIKLFVSGNYYQARLNNLGAELYQVAPHQGFKRNGKIYRDEETKEGEYIYLYAEDQKSARDYYAKSKNYFDKVKASKSVNQEIINFNFDYADFLINNGGGIPRPIDMIKDSKGKKNLGKMENNQLIIFLYDEVFELNKIANDRHNEALSLFKKSAYFIRKNGMGFNYETSQDKMMVSENPLPFLKQLIKDYPKDELAPEAVYGVAQIYAAKQDFITALEYYSEILKSYPKSIRVSDAKAEIQEIKSKSLTINNTGIQASKNKPKINITAKNIETIEITVYKTNLLDVLSKQTKADIYFNNFNQNFGDKVSDIKKHAGQKVLTLKNNLKEKNDYKVINKEIILPDLKAGSYLVEANDDNGHASISLLIISDITIVKNIDKNKAVIHILNRETGKPIKNANILVKEHYYDNDSSGYKLNTVESKTNNQGEFVYKKDTKENSYSYIDVLAYNKDQIIFSNAQYYYNSYTENNTYKGYIYTDRPVYRPEQKLNFKEIITFNTDGKNTNLKEKKVHITINDPKGNQVFEKDLTTNNYGSINDSFTLKKGAALGMYYINTSIEKNDYGISQSGGQSFRVE